MRRRSLFPLIWLILFFGLTGTLFLYSNEERVVRVGDLLSEMKETKGVESIFEYDTNEDGQVDYLVKFDDKGEKLAEALDYNHDGFMDDFHYYKNGMLVERLIDSNYDTNIDVWVYLSEGVYVQKYEQDSNHDGVIDTIKNFGNEM